MDRRAFLSVSLVSVGAWCWSSSPSTAHAAPKREAVGFVEKTHQELQTAIKVSKDPKRDPRLLDIFDRSLDYGYLTTETLGEHAGALTPEQRTEFDGALRELVRASYRKNLRDPSGYAVAYTGETPLDGATLVFTVTTNKQNKREKPLSVDYQVAQLGPKYLIQDVVTGGVSLVKNYRRQFGRIIKRQGFAALMDMMKKRLAELG